MANFSFQGKRPSPEFLSQIAALFGKVSHTFTPTHLRVQYDDGARSHGDEMAYRVDDFTSSTVTLAFPGSDVRGLTLYRADGSYFVRSGDNLEYFRKIAA